MDMIVKRDLGKKVRDVPSGGMFIFVDQDISEGVYVRVNPEPIFYSECRGDVVVVKIADEADRDEKFGTTRSTPVVGCVKECEGDTRVYEVEFIETPKLKII